MADQEILLRGILEPLELLRPEGAKFSLWGIVKRWCSGFLSSASLILCLHLGLEGVTAAYAVLPLWAILTWMVAMEIRQWLQRSEEWERVRAPIIDEAWHYLERQRLNEVGHFVEGRE